MSLRRRRRNPAPIDVDKFYEPIDIEAREESFRDTNNEVKEMRGKAARNLARAAVSTKSNQQRSESERVSASTTTTQQNKETYLKVSDAVRSYSLPTQPERERLRQGTMRKRLNPSQGRCNSAGEPTAPTSRRPTQGTDKRSSGKRPLEQPSARSKSTSAASHASRDASSGSQNEVIEILDSDSDHERDCRVYTSKAQQKLSSRSQAFGIQGISSRQIGNNDSEPEVIELTDDEDDLTTILRSSPPRKKARTRSPIASSSKFEPPPNRLVTPPEEESLVTNEIWHMEDDDEDPNNWNCHDMDVDMTQEEPLPALLSPSFGRANVIETLKEEEYDSDSSEFDLPGLDLDDEKWWKPLPHDTKLDIRGEDEDSMSLDDEVGRRTAKPAYRPRERVETARWFVEPKPLRGPPVFIWDQLRMADHILWPVRPRSALVDPKKVCIRDRRLDMNLSGLKLANSFKFSPATINAIDQYGEYMVVASATPGGASNGTNSRLDPYNMPGSLLAYSKGVEILFGHQACMTPNTCRLFHPQSAADIPPSTAPSCSSTKQYTVSDVKFDRSSDCPSFVSCGTDRKVYRWTMNSNRTQWVRERTHGTYSVPTGLLFQPDSSVFAVAARRIIVYDGDTEGSFEFDRSQNYVIGSIAWGSDSDPNFLFASSEPNISATRRFIGAHGMFDIQEETTDPVCVFACDEAGDALALDSQGTTLALCTQADVNQHTLRIFDVRRRLPTVTTTITIEPFETRPEDENFEGEINVATFSPDGMQLALARNDNHTHIYDMRMLERGPMFDYSHFGPDKATSRKEVYGVVQAQWVLSASKGHMMLLTGGEDGCVRSWDCMRAVADAENGTVLAEVDSDVAQFSVGDPYAGEHRLVVGDATGRISIFNKLAI